MSHQDSRKKYISRIACLVALYLIFTKQVNLPLGIQFAPYSSELFLKQIQEFFSTRGLPSSSYPDSLPPTIETAIFVKSHLKTWLFSLPRGALELSKPCSTRLNLVVLQGLLSLRGSRPAPGALHCCTMAVHVYFTIGFGSFKNSTNGKYTLICFWFDFKPSGLECWNR